MTAIISCLTNSYGRFGAQAAIEKVRQAGIEWIELPFGLKEPNRSSGVTRCSPTRAPPDDLSGVARRLADHDVRLSSCNVTSGNPLDPEVLAVTLATGCRPRPRRGPGGGRRR
ncbi:MAG: hypothetical protein CM1200mP2_59340 [Planctomycetaceae bacterium]|nr:MAG: hypothetical protein CM1200mP2_59340 [Planctomycetaceae bacterium]